MLTHPTHDRLIALGLTGMAKALEDQRRQPDIAALAFEERIAMMIDREAIERENKRLTTRLKFACLRQSAVIEDVDMKAPRGLDKALFQKLAAGDWIDRHQNLIVIGKTGVGKSWLACALGHKACRDDRSVSYQRVPRLFDALALARGDGRHARLLKNLAREALRGRVTKHHRFLLRLHLNQIDALDAAMATVDAQVEENLGPFRTAVEQIISIPGVKNLGAHVIVSEIGIDMSRFPSAAHLLSWACICPGNDESAGKRRSNRMRKGAPWLKATLLQCAWAAVRKKDSYLQAQFYRIKVRRGPKKAIMAVAASILTAIYHMLKDGTMYQDLGCNHFDRRSTDQQKKRLVKRLADLGYAVEIKPLAAMA